MTVVIKAVNLGISFILELLALFIYGWYGYGTGTLGWQRILLAIILPVTAAVFWGRYLAPNASGRFAMPGLLIAKIAIMAVAAVMLLRMGKIMQGGIFFAAAAANILLAAVLGQE
ncbi:YrdB family protein [Youngiibacter fragilis]|uniref:DUF2568 domain-containing protein n=1 Tax=Youngiibacter fragilis 232.1 TaxID=994573 RepID=V7IAE6_9CLOT|nr:YrdB family protein [Youngiibacter fragilis]ETA82276.1 hypothetical protein T472_0201975 [Youngiibacter fragilis 232.1]